MATSILVPLSEYLSTSYEHDREWVDGRLLERGLPDEYRSAIEQFFLEYFGRIKRDLAVRVRAELRVRVGSQNYRIPDVTLIRADAPFGPIPTDPPILCIEVLSPDDRPADLHEKIADYLKMGVANIWIVDPRRRLMSIADQHGIHSVDIFHLPGTSARVTSAELFAELAELEAIL